MPGPAFHFEVLRLAIDALAAGSAAEKAKAKLMNANLPYARLGALGPDFLRYRPVPVAALDTLVSHPDLSTLSDADRKALSQQIAPNPEMALYGYLYRVLVPRFDGLRTADAMLANLAAVAAAEDLDQLKGLKDSLDAVKTELDSFQNLRDELKTIYGVGVGAMLAGRPVIESDKPGFPQFWRPFEFMRWKRTATFSRSLLKQAKNDDQLRAYAYGYMSHVAGAVVGEPFVNTIVGGPYRTHWWRNKWVRNHVDAWTFGRYHTTGAAMAGDTPTPDYAEWSSLCGPKTPVADSPCGTDLQNLFRLDPLEGKDAATAVQTGVMPPTPGFDKVGNAFIAAAADAFGASSGAGPAIKTPAGLGDLAALQGAYVGAVSVMWFMTGTETLCPRDPGPPPAGAETPPAWFASAGSLPPASTGGGGGGGGGGGSGGAATVSAIIAAILAVIAIAIGNIIVGVAAVVFAIAAAIEAGDAASVDWAGLRGTVYWLQVLFFQVENGIHKALVGGGVAYPFARELGTPPSGIFGWTPVSDQSLVALTRSRRTTSYPLRMDERMVNGKLVPADTFFVESPASALEMAATRPAFDVLAYPDRILDGKGLLNGGMVTDNGVFPTRDQDFGGAVANAAQVISTDAVTLVNYNLDGDRGYGWKTWKPKPGTTLTDPAATVEVAVES